MNIENKPKPEAPIIIGRVMRKISASGSVIEHEIIAADARDKTLILRKWRKFEDELWTTAQEMTFEAFQRWYRDTNQQYIGDTAHQLRLQINK